MQDETPLLTLTDESGQEHVFALMASFQLDDKTYVLLTPQDQLEAEDPEILAMRYSAEEDMLHPIEDEAEFNRMVEFVNSQRGE